MRVASVPPKPLRLDLADGIDDRVEGEQRRGMTRLEVAHRLEDLEVLPFPEGGVPFSLSMARISSRTARSSAAVAPTI